MKFCATSERPRRSKTKLVLLYNNFVGYLFFSMLYNLLKLFKNVQNNDKIRVIVSQVENSGFGGVQRRGRWLLIASGWQRPPRRPGMGRPVFAKESCCWLLMNLPSGKHTKSY